MAALKRGARPVRKQLPVRTALLQSDQTAYTPEFCARCGHSRESHTEEIIPPGQYGEGGRCSWWKDPMFSPTEDCSCHGFQAQRPKS
jgi:hypothetical protein